VCVFVSACVLTHSCCAPTAQICTQVDTAHSLLSVRRWVSNSGVLTIDVGVGQGLSSTQLVFETEESDHISRELAAKLKTAREAIGGSVGLPVVDIAGALPLLPPITVGRVRRVGTLSPALGSTMAVLRSCVDATVADGWTAAMLPENPTQRKQLKQHVKRGPNSGASASAAAAAGDWPRLGRVGENVVGVAPASARFDLLQNQMTLLRTQASERMLMGLSNDHASDDTRSGCDDEDHGGYPTVRAGDEGDEDGQVGSGSVDNESHDNGNDDDDDNDYGNDGVAHGDEGQGGGARVYVQLANDIQVGGSLVLSKIPTPPINQLLNFISPSKGVSSPPPPLSLASLTHARTHA
jgi:hypothetical protein